MAGRYLAIELQDENGDVLYPHTEADIVYSSDGTTVEENLSGEVTDADIQEIFGDSQVEAGKKLSVKEKIKKALKKYQTLLAMKILDTMEEVEANTDDGYLMGAKAGAELINDLVSDIYVGDDGKLHKVQGGADTVLPFKQNNIVSLGSMPTSLDVKQFIIDNELPIDYSKLSNSNFLPVINSISAEGGRDWISGGASYSYVPRISYNSNTGILTTNGNAYFYRSSNGLILKVNAKCTLYLAY